MAVNPYTSVSISGYNSSPPPDDGSQTSANKVEWAKHKTKLADPLKTLIESVNTNAIGACNALALEDAFVSTTTATIAEQDWHGVYLQLATGRINYPDPTAFENGWHHTVYNGSTGVVQLQATATNFWRVEGAFASEALLQPGRTAKPMNTATVWLPAFLDATATIRAGEVMQTQYSFIATCVTATGIITGGLPAATDGTQHLSVSVTPNKLGNLIEIQSSVFAGSQTNSTISSAMFQGTASAAIACAIRSFGGTDDLDTLDMTTWVTATQSTAYTFTIRVGSGSGAHTLNGTSGGIQLGGGLRSFIKVMEYNV